MASRMYQDMAVKSSSGDIVLYDAECYCDHEGNTVFAVYGQNEDSLSQIANNRVAIANQLRQDFSKDVGREVSQISLWVDRGSDTLEGSHIEYDSERNVTRATADYADSKDIKSVTDLGKSFDDKDYANQMDLSMNTIKREPDISR